MIKVVLHRAWDRTRFLKLGVSYCDEEMSSSIKIFSVEKEEIPF